MATDAVTLIAVGDVLVNRDEPKSIFELTATTLSQADIAICQIETLYSEKGQPQVAARVPLRAHPRNIEGLTYAGFDVVSVASNHSGDFGMEAFLDNIENLRKANLQVIGGGNDLAEARKPAIVEKKGVRVAFLAYNSILPAGYAAFSDRPGCSPIRVRTIYEPIEPDQPGTPSRIITVPYSEDMNDMKDDITKAKAQADMVVLMLHWGLHHVPVALAGYQREVGHAAIDAGADVIIGHHAHILKGVEVYNGKAIFYSLGNFAFDVAVRQWKTSSIRRDILKDIPAYRWESDPEYPTYPFKPDARKTLLVNLLISNKHIQKVTILPALINKKGQPEILRGGSKEGQEVLDFVNEASKDLGTKLVFEGDEALVC
ncbi:MAG: CapA family protein [Chloroflexi bacterium]|nr:CapA family protein [Chloroflexota bacterium]